MVFLCFFVFCVFVFNARFFFPYADMCVSYADIWAGVVSEQGCSFLMQRVGGLMPVCFNSSSNSFFMQLFSFFMHEVSFLMQTDPCLKLRGFGTPPILGNGRGTVSFLFSFSFPFFLSFLLSLTLLCIPLFFPVFPFLYASGASL